MPDYDPDAVESPAQGHSLVPEKEACLRAWKFRGLAVICVVALTIPMGIIANAYQCPQQVELCPAAPGCAAACFATPPTIAPGGIVFTITPPFGTIPFNATVSANYTFNCGAGGSAACGLCSS